MDVAKMRPLLVFSLFSAFVSATAQSQTTCTGLDQLSQNTNPSLLSNCAKDDDCTRVTCQPAGILRNYLSSAILTLTDPCSTSPPGVRLQLQATSGSALVDETVTSPTTIRRTVGFVTATITVFVNSSASAVGISIDPVAVSAVFFSSSDYLISFTSIPLDLSSCQSPTTAAPEESTVTAIVQSGRTCLDLDQLAMNTNPSYLSNCARDAACTRVTCEGSGVLSGQIDSAAIILAPCVVPTPGIRVSLVRSGSVVANQLITGQMTITYNAGIATVTANVFVNNTASSIGILIDPVTISSVLGTNSDYLISFTSVQLDRSSCVQPTERASTESDPEGPTATNLGDEPTTTLVGIADKGTGAAVTTIPGQQFHTTTLVGIADKGTGAAATTIPGQIQTTSSVFDTCAGLEQLALNANLVLLSNCARDDRCTQVTCEAAGIISSQLDSMTVTLELCETPPGVTIELLKDGRVIINRLITTPTNVTQSLNHFVTVSAYVFVNSTQDALGIAVDPVIINAGPLGFGSDTLMNFTLVPYSTPQCGNIGSAQNTALRVVLSFDLFLLTLACSCIYQ